MSLTIEALAILVLRRHVIAAIRATYRTARVPFGEAQERPTQHTTDFSERENDNLEAAPTGE